MPRPLPPLHALVEIPDADHNDESLLDRRALVNAVVSLADRVGDGSGGSRRA